MQASAKLRNSASHRYHRVLDSRKRRVRGLWQRNGRFFANLSIADDLGRKTPKWVPLDGATLTEVIADYRKLLVERQDDRLRPLGLTPTLADYLNIPFLEAENSRQRLGSDAPAPDASGHLNQTSTRTDENERHSYANQLLASGKRQSSIQKECTYLRRWAKDIGHMRLNKLRPFHLNQVLTKLAQEGYSGRTVNLFLITIRSALKSALRDGYIKPPLPFEGLEWQRVDTKSRRLVTAQDIDKLCDVALQASKNGRQFVDYLRFLQYSGARRSEALEVRWQDADFDRGILTIGAEGNSKNREPRTVNFNSSLEAHLRDMARRRQPDSRWLFPSPQRGDNDTPTRTFMEALRLTRNASGVVCKKCGKSIVGVKVVRCAHCRSKRLEQQSRLLPAELRRIGFHDLRHHFASYAVMSGIDFMTIARWLGHKDGGILIGKVYGHLADDHRKAQAARMNFGPAVVPLQSPATNPSFIGGANQVPG
ncbi:MAG: site-specific integrase [Anaerolineales bacterium]